MRKLLASLFIFVLIVVIVIPLLVVRGCSFLPGEGHTEERLVRVFNQDTKEYYSLEMEEYIKGVVAAEMPASFELEALKAQAVAARTYLVKHLLVKRGQGEEAVISTDFKVGQAWISPSELRQKWGIINYIPYWLKIQKAVNETEGIILTYDGEPISAVYHSDSGGRTEDAVYVWGQRFPYLKSLASPFDQVDPEYYRTMTFTGVQLISRLGVSGDKITIQVTKRSPSGRALEVKINDRIFTGIELRSKLGLPSTKFTLEDSEGKVIFKLWGEGHGVGMSQYGANGMAQKGYKFHEILKYYYPETKLERIDQWLKTRNQPIF
ncbi:MAG: stage II sporulation protein D [Halanaerobium sp.]|nr:stage II sporulation protein D [Halanaerobium sp.]